MLAASPVISSQDIRAEIWAKLWGNMNMNPVSALTRLTANGIFGEPQLFDLVRDMMTEFVRVGERLGITLPMSVDERLVTTQRLGDFRTSMLNDVEAGRAAGGRRACWAWWSSWRTSWASRCRPAARSTRSPAG